MHRCIGHHSDMCWASFIDVYWPPFRLLGLNQLCILLLLFHVVERFGAVSQLYTALFVFTLAPSRHMFVFLSRFLTLHMSLPLSLSLRLPLHPFLLSNKSQCPFKKDVYRGRPFPHLFFKVCFCFKCLNTFKPINKPWHSTQPHNWKIILHVFLFYTKICST